jgi:hypothetical protein
LPNSAPILAAISDKECTLGQTLVFTASASDTDAPPQQLTFSLGPGAPSGAAIDSVSGQFRWTPAAAPDSRTINIVVTDSGTPSLSATQTCRVTILPPPPISVQVNENQMRLDWPRGTLQESDVVTGPYRDVTGISPLTVDLSEASKFYRIRL